MEMEEPKNETVYQYQHQHRPRSEARARYYKPAAGNFARRTHTDASRGGFKERFVLQAIICGGFLAVLLFFNVVDTNFTNAVTGWIERNIAFDMLAEDDAPGWINTIVEVFSGEDNFHFEAVPAYHADDSMADDFRIDENILHEINAAVDVYYENNVGYIGN